MADLDNLLPIIKGPVWPGVRLFCTTRQGGLSTAPYSSLNLSTKVGDAADIVQKNRQRLNQMLPSQPFWLHQVHDNRVIDADLNPIDRMADAAVTCSSQQVLAIMVADCLPIVLSDLRGRVLGLAHAGWRGLATGILENTLTMLQAKLPQNKNWRAWLGPCIGPQVFEVGEEVYKVLAHPPETLTFFTLCSKNKWLLDLAGLAAWRLRQAGVHEITKCSLCTLTNPQLFFSYRRHNQTGRMAVLAWRELS